MWLASERLLPSRRIGGEREHVRGIIGEEDGDLGIESATPALSDDRGRMLGAAQHVLDRRVASDVSDPQRQWDLLAAGATQRAVSVPALREIHEQALHRCGEAELRGQHRRDIADRGQVRRVDPCRPRQPSDHLEGLHPGRARRIGQSAHDPGEELALPSHHDRGEVLGQAAAERLGENFGVGCASGVHQHAGVVGRRRGLTVDPQTVSETHGDQRAAQTMLQGQAHAEVGPQAQRPHHLGGADPLVGLRTPDGHPETVRR
jgi:hypothetical protein